MTKLHIGDRVRVLHVEEMLKRDAVVQKNDIFGKWVQFFDENNEEIEDAIFPICDIYTDLSGKLFTIKHISKDGKIDLEEDNQIGYAVTKEMIDKIS